MDTTNFAASASGFDDIDTLLGSNDALDQLLFPSKGSPSAASSASRYAGSVFSAASPSNSGASETATTAYQSPESSHGDVVMPSDWDEWKPWLDMDWGQGATKSPDLGSGADLGGTSPFDFSFAMPDSSPFSNMFQPPSSVGVLTPGIMSGVTPFSPNGAYPGYPQFPVSPLTSIAEVSPLAEEILSDSPTGSAQASTPVEALPQEAAASAGSAASRKKRKLEGNDDGSPPETAPKAAKASQGRQHSNIEARYRSKLNDMIARLRDAVPSLKPDAKDPSKDDASVTKGRILSEATEYIVELENSNKKLKEKNAMLQRQLMALGKVNGRLLADQDSGSRRSSSSSSGSSSLSKLMVGGMAGMLAMQGYSATEQSAESPGGRGLFAVPVHLLGQFGHSFDHVSFLMGSSSFDGTFVVLRAVLLVAAVIYIFLPSLFDAVARTQRSENVGEKTAVATAADTQALSGNVTTPKEARRNAFLTADQTIKLPRQTLHIFAAIALEAVKFGLRSIGIDLAVFTQLLLKSSAPDDGQEASAARSWDIALDAQLAGGDEEASPSRLLLTLLSSLSLPETPYRLMLQAMHARVLSECQQEWWMGLAKPWLEKLSTAQWLRARELHEKAPGQPAAGQGASGSSLPRHMASLLELDVQDVFTDDALQRSCHLALGQERAEEGPADLQWIDEIVEEGAARTPLDLLAAWRSAALVRDAMADYVDVGPGEAADESGRSPQEALDLALRIAPPATTAWSRAILAKALLVESTDVNAEAAIRALLITSWQRAAVLYVPADAQGTAPMTTMPPLPPDVGMALSCAIAASRLHSPETEKALESLSARVDASKTGELGVLGFVALYHFLDVIFRDTAVAEKHRGLCEKVAGLLRVWVREQAGSGEAGLSREGEKAVATLCVSVLEWLVGIPAANGDAQA